MNLRPMKELKKGDVFCTRENFTFVCVDNNIDEKIIFITTVYNFLDTEIDHISSYGPTNSSYLNYENEQVDFYFNVYEVRSNMEKEV